MQLFSFDKQKQQRIRVKAGGVKLSKNQGMNSRKLIKDLKEGKA